MKLTKQALKRIIKEEIEAELEGSDQKKWFTVNGFRPGDKSGRDWIELAIVELPESFTISHDSSGLYAKLTEEGYDYIATIPGVDANDYQVKPREKPFVKHWEGTAPTTAAKGEFDPVDGEEMKALLAKHKGQRIDFGLGDIDLKKRNKLIITYGGNQGCTIARSVDPRLAKHGFPTVAQLKELYPEHEETGGCDYMWKIVFNTSA